MKKDASVRHPICGSRILGIAVATGSYADLAAVRLGFSDAVRSRAKIDVEGGKRTLAAPRAKVECPQLKWPVFRDQIAEVIAS